jgi:hypothetical protein
MSDVLQPSIFPAVASAVAAIASAATAAFTYFLNRRVNPLSVTAKLMDRLYELNRLALQYPKEFAAFLDEANRTTPYFYGPASDASARETLVRVRSIAYFHLDFFDEIFLASKSRLVKRTFEGENWLRYIDQRMRHRLLQELFEHEGGKVYQGAFAGYVRSKWAEYQQPCDVGSW